MQSGKYRQRVTLLRRTDAQRPSGQVSHAYTSFATNVPAGVSDIVGREFFAAAQVQSEVTTRIRIRWRPDVDSTCRVERIIQHDSPQIVESYDIVAALADEKTNRRELILMCRKNPAVGARG